ncbi:sugar transferase [Photobacterium alginatilyticum]|uniref:Sugar transferase n=1 Tax=Photobacterium alginatilyticum TaxID=1775171 RepID=A0ABW9YDU6_9GAMM|nr:sugar transferase [Photobacterium alginatilyticum]NBI51610.1 sugar transferase [Photobacterium alginatilyticum]
MNQPIIRLIDLTLSFLGLLLLWPILLLVCVCGFFDTGSPVFRQKRVGKNGKPFVLIKLRTMPISTASVATHMVDASSVTKFGAFLRKSKLDELPQLINVLRGEMSFVGPRPSLYNQEELIEERNKRGVLDVLPGITGLAQVNGVDMSVPKQLASLDAEMIETFSLSLYFRLILQTATGKGSGDRVRS